jgi:hypothetical protein
MININEYIYSINYIRNTDNTVIDKSNIDIKKHSSKYSNTKTPLYKIHINNEPISRNNKFYINFNCITCDSVNEITLNIFARKVNKNIKGCFSCMNIGENKRINQSNFMKENASDIFTFKYIKTHEKKLKDLTFTEKLNMSEESFNKESCEFIEKYYINNFTKLEFDNIRNKIVSIGNGKITKEYLSELVYYPTFIINNQTKYTPILYHPITYCIEKPKYISYMCDNCESVFTNRDLYIQKKNTKLFCRDCSLTNRIFKIRYMKLKNGEKIRYQSTPEKRFIKWCDNNNIKIKNGPNIPFSFDGKDRKYYVDFDLPERRIIVEIKDNHIWHKQQLENGKWGKKEEAAIKWCETNSYSFELIFPINMATFKNKLLKI